MNNYPSIVALHYVSDDRSLDDLKPWVISKSSFLQLLDFIENDGYHTLVFEDFQNSAITDKGIVLTFDDCPKSLWDFAIPELVKRKMKAVFYMPTACLGGVNKWNSDAGLPKLDLMDEIDLKKLIEIGMEVGSHAHNHTMLGELTIDESIKELTTSKSILEKILDKPVISVAYPYGSIPKGYNKIAKKIGFQYGLAIFVKWQTVYSIRRWTYTDEDDLNTIKWKISAGYRWYRFFSDNWRFYSKAILSNSYKMYSKLKHSINTYIALELDVLSFENLQYI